LQFFSSIPHYYGKVQCNSGKNANFTEILQREQEQSQKHCTYRGQRKAEGGNQDAVAVKRDAVPLLGTGIILLPWSLISLVQGNSLMAIGLLATYGVASVCRTLWEPRLLGKQLGLDPLVTLMALYFGYQAWGILGMIFSPLLAVTAIGLTRDTPNSP
jgi:hypothetical protein